MPVELADGTLGKVLLSRRDIVALRKVLDHLGAQPTTWIVPGLGVGEPPFEVWHEATIGGLLT